MPGTIQSTMIRASAGSGKTFQLANRFLALMVLGVAPEKIIALTFTRKAAGEFTGRIMTRLADGAADENGATALAAQLEEIIRGTDSIPALVSGSVAGLPVMDAGFFQGKLETLIDALDRLALSTLDSYFVRIVRNFSLELGLSGFDLMEDTAISAERLSVMATIFSNHQTRKDEREAFLQSFKQATWGEEENRLCQTLEDFVKKHQNRWLAAPDPERWGGIDRLWEKGCPYPEGGDYTARAGRVRSLLGDIENAHGSYLNSWKKACDWMETRVKGTPVGTLPARLTDAIVSMDDFKMGRYLTVFSKREQVIKGELAAAIADMAGGFIRDEIEVQMKRTQGLYSVISAYEKRYHQHVRSRGRLCFSDLTLLLAGEGAMKLWEEDVRGLIDFRLDARYDHWLLDEFQDTSQPQWQAVSNLVDEIMQDTDGQRSVFVVGDSKQSIYGWRGGEPRLFDDLKEHYGERLAEWDMDRSYRSSQSVLDLVNTVCDLSAPKWRSIFPPAAIDRWLYHPHEPSGDKPGHTLVLETTLDAKDTDGDEKTGARFACMKSLIEKTEPLAHGLTCAILVSKNDQVTDIVDFLRTELPHIPVASESESVVADGPEGAVILDLFRWLRNPAHTFGQIHVSMSPLGEIINELCDTNDPKNQWRWLTGEVARHGVEALVGKIVISLRDRLTISDYGQSRLDEILAAANDFSVKGGSLDDWVSMLESRSLRETTREGVIQVMTIHKCKGLGFDMVILPELGGGKEFTDAGRLDALEKKGHLGTTEYVIKKPTKDICEADPALREMMAAWEADQCYERFCNLYVALTRAKQATYCILDPVKDGWEPRKKYDDWIREATASFTAREVLLGEVPYKVLYESGGGLPTGGRRQETGVGEVPTKPLQPATPRLARKIASQTKKQQAGDLLRNGKGMRFGNVVHAHFEKITWLDELPELDDKAAAGLVLECLETKSIRPHFMRPQGDYQLLREQPFETRQDDQWISGVIDRAVIHLENGKPVRITIIDFKTDRDESTESLAGKYSGQLDTYRTAMHRITGVPEEDITCFLLSTALKEMVPV
ncbi:MAG: UvrD-helicase domain-containing protein [Akkermansiaceae bacterium]|nr:UvrD-helicase domain-containing protein [Akkermansiaceae bacterium]